MVNGRVIAQFQVHLGEVHVPAGRPVVAPIDIAVEDADAPLGLQPLLHHVVVLLSRIATGLHGPEALDPPLAVRVAHHDDVHAGHAEITVFDAPMQQ